MENLFVQCLFYIFSALAVGSALLVISQNNPVRCVLFLVLAFFAAAGVWLLAEAEFLSLILILVYVGAVMTLFLFVVMMLNIDVESLKNHYMRYLPFGLILVAFLTGLLLVAIPIDSFKPLHVAPGASKSLNSELMNVTPQDSGVVMQTTLPNIERLGLVLYTDYLLAFELAAVILLVAIVSAITLMHRGTIRSKKQDVKQQIMTRSTDRLELISMNTEK